MMEYKNIAINELAREFTVDSEAFAKHMELIKDINHLTINIFILAASFAAEDIKYAYNRNMISTQFRRYFNRFVGEIISDDKYDDESLSHDTINWCAKIKNINIVPIQDNETLTETEQPVIDYITRASFMLRNTIAFNL